CGSVAASSPAHTGAGCANTMQAYEYTTPSPLTVQDRTWRWSTVTPEPRRIFPPRASIASHSAGMSRLIPPSKLMNTGSAAPLPDDPVPDPDEPVPDDVVRA